ncbi:MAG: hypothetical protein QXY80_03705 [Candidatus Jordarchaeales archaeon]
MKGKLVMGDERLLYEVATETVREWEASTQFDYIKPYGGENEEEAENRKNTQKAERHK